MKLLHMSLFLSLMLAGCSPATSMGTQANPTETPISMTSTPETQSSLALEAGFRFSSYGPQFNPGPEYWASVGGEMAAKFAEAKPAALWIVGTLDGDGTYLNFDCKAADPNIRCAYVDMNEQTLTLFDEKGFDVWLQVEPGNANVDELIDIVLNQYKHHPSVVGFGVDVEWYQSTNGPEGEPISDEVAKRWVEKIRKHNPKYRLFLKHWDQAWMPPTVRDGIFFIDDSQQFESFEAMVNEFTAWGNAFAPAPVGFQYGYPADRPWWQGLQDPPTDIGQAILEHVSNTKGLFWVDFTVLDIFPPK